MWAARMLIATALTSDESRGNGIASSRSAGGGHGAGDCCVSARPTARVTAPGRVRPLAAVSCCVRTGQQPAQIVISCYSTHAAGAAAMSRPPAQPAAASIQRRSDHRLEQPASAGSGFAQAGGAMVARECREPSGRAQAQPGTQGGAAPCPDAAQQARRGARTRVRTQRPAERVTRRGQGHAPRV